MPEIFADDRADAIFLQLSETPDRVFRPERDGTVFQGCLGALKELGYPEADAKEFLLESLAECED